MTLIDEAKISAGSTSNAATDFVIMGGENMRRTRKAGIVCQDVDNAVEAHLLRNCPEPDEAIRAHVAGCPRCTILYGPLPGKSGVAPCLEQSITDRLTSGLKRVAPLPSHRSIVLRFAVLFVLLVLFAVSLMGRQGLAAMSPGQMARMFAVFGLSALLFSVSLSQQIAPGSRQWLSPVAVIAIFAAGFLAGAFFLFPSGDPRLWFHMGSQCTRSGLLMAVPAGLLISALVVRGFALSLPMVGATVGGAAGLVAAVALQIRCNEQTAMHIGFWHGSAVAIVTLAGLLAGAVLGHSRRRRIFANKQASPR